MASRFRRGRENWLSSNNGVTLTSHHISLARQTHTHTHANFQQVGLGRKHLLPPLLHFFHSTPRFFFSLYAAKTASHTHHSDGRQGRDAWFFFPFFLKMVRFRQRSFVNQISFLVWSNVRAFGALKKWCVHTPINFTCGDALA